MAKAVLAFNEQLERLGEFAVVLVIGALLAGMESLAPGAWIAAAIFVFIRPLATLLTLARETMSHPQRAFIAWFGVRGVSSLYYLAFALTHGLHGPDARALADAALLVVATSIVVHGVSVTPLMSRYSAPAEGRNAQTVADANGSS
jgi:NhaP-type Na+/H+ or K+/H+ antiporter